MDLNFIPIQKWPDKLKHLKNINIALTVAQGKTFSQTGKIFKISAQNIFQIYRIIMCELCMKKFNLSWDEAMHDKKYYYHENRSEIIQEYKTQYMIYKKIKKEPQKSIRAY